MSTIAHCTRCDSTGTVPIVWGMPSPELLEAIGAGEIDAIIGGCCVEVPAPTHECQRCGSRFADGEEWFQPATGSVFSNFPIGR